MNPELAQKILEQTQVSYNAIAQKFSRTRNREWPIMQRLVDSFVKSGDSVLDIGCGNGRMLEVLDNKNVSYTGIDSSSELIKLASQQGGTFMVKDILKMDFNQEFDVVFAFAVLNHIPSHKLRLLAMQKIYQSLKPGGLFICSNWNLWRLSLKQKTIWHYKLRGYKKAFFKGLGFRDIITTFNVEGKKHPLYYFAFYRRRFSWLAEKAGFEVLESYYEKGGDPSTWQKGNNLITVCRKK